MAVSANITAPTGTQSGNFNVTVTFASAVEGFTAADITIAAVSGNGTTSVTYQVTGSGATYNVPFQLPEDVVGSFSISITGQVVDSEDVEQDVIVTPRTVLYDNLTTNVGVTFKTVVYGEGGIIVVPVNFGEIVIAPSKTIFNVKKLIGDDLAGIDYVLVGEGRNYNLIFENLGEDQDGRGVFRITPEGYVQKALTGVWDNIQGAPLIIGYQWKVPQIENITLPVEIATNLFESVISFDNIVSHLWIWDFGYGVELEGDPALYRSLNFETLPDLPVLVNENDLREPGCIGDWEYVSTIVPSLGFGRFFVLRFRRKSTDKRIPDLVLNQGSYFGYYDP